jgi:hypothetical protein
MTLVDDAKKAVSEERKRKEAEHNLRLLEANKELAINNLRIKNLLQKFEKERNKTREEIETLINKLKNEGLRVTVEEGNNEVHFLDHYGNSPAVSDSWCGLFVFSAKWTITEPSTNKWTWVQLSFEYKSHLQKRFFGLITDADEALIPSTTAKQAEEEIRAWLVKIFS